MDKKQIQSILIENASLVNDSRYEIKENMELCNNSLASSYLRNELKGRYYKNKKTWYINKIIFQEKIIQSGTECSNVSEIEDECSNISLSQSEHSIEDTEDIECQQSVSDNECSNISLSQSEHSIEDTEDIECQQSVSEIEDECSNISLSQSEHSIEDTEDIECQQSVSEIEDECSKVSLSQKSVSEIEDECSKVSLSQKSVSDNECSKVSLSQSEGDNEYEEDIECQQSVSDNECSKVSLSQSEHSIKDTEDIECQQSVSEIEDTGDNNLENNNECQQSVSEIESVSDYIDLTEETQVEIIDLIEDANPKLEIINVEDEESYSERTNKNEKQYSYSTFYKYLPDEAFYQIIEKYL